VISIYAVAVWVHKVLSVYRLSWSIDIHVKELEELLVERKQIKRKQTVGSRAGSLSKEE
jgi:hypothetical protein